MNSSNRPSRIHLIDAGGRHEEGVAAAVIKPGQLIARNSSGGLIPHASAGSYAEKLIALEDALQGKGIDQNYAVGDVVPYIVCQPGEVVQALLSGGENADLSEFLTSNGDGTFKVATSTDQRLAVPVEAVNASDSNDVDERIKIRML